MSAARVTRLVRGKTYQDTVLADAAQSMGTRHGTRIILHSSPSRRAALPLERGGRARGTAYSLKKSTPTPYVHQKILDSHYPLSGRKVAGGRGGHSEAHCMSTSSMDILYICVTYGSKRSDDGRTRASAARGCANAAPAAMPPPTEARERERAALALWATPVDGAVFK